MAIRSRAERRADALRRLDTEDHVWIATAGDDGTPHLIPLSLFWDGSQITVYTPTDSPTVRNAAASGRARAALDSASDVVLIDADAEVHDLEQLAPELVDRFVARSGWDPRTSPGAYSAVVLHPTQVIAFNGEPEMQGRLLMRAGAWIDE